ncbi:hypothetical protein [Janthinobacterium aquaticum]|uniref:hypothetical protein n=1 Tax=Janthinobacterium sp. FT58W TaxID=2654254 RepID=UPI0012641449|nr:hypothetical protein [Janthinobacterium sp. FT58W]KAB8044508.1 hypothetical protein GCM43_04720 [Janthinobacterium sp. FT58W]
MRIVAIAMAALLLTGARPALALDAPKLNYKEETAFTGTHIRRDVLRDSWLPINQTYQEMSPEYQRKLRAVYNNLAEDDEPPFPLHGLGPSIKQLREVHRRIGGTGEMKLILSVDSNGDVGDVSVYSASNARMAYYGAILLSKEKFKPGVCHGAPCAMEFMYRFEYAFFDDVIDDTAVK